MRKFLRTYPAFFACIVLLYGFGFTVLCSVSWSFGYYAQRLTNLPLRSMVMIGLIGTVLCFTMLIISIALQLEQGRLVLWRSSKSEMLLLTLGVGFGIGVLALLSMYGHGSIFISILVYPLVAYLLLVLWLVRWVCFLREGKRYQKLSWLRFAKQYSFRTPIFKGMAAMAVILLCSFVYEVVLRSEKNIPTLLFGCLGFLLLTALAGFLADYSQNNKQELEQIVAEKLRSERLKTELIANVSHDIKTPLTSIINYADLLAAQEPQDPQVREYTDVIHKKSLRLKSLIEDLIEASKASTGNLKMNLEPINICELLGQILGEYDESMEQAQLQFVAQIPEEGIFIEADGRYLWRVLENVFSNTVKYAMAGTRVYAELKTEGELCVFTLKNVARDALNISAEELTEQFVRGDRSRSTEGNGLGLYIAKSLTEAMGGIFSLHISGDLFEVRIAVKKIGEFISSSEV